MKKLVRVVGFLFLAVSFSGLSCKQDQKAGETIDPLVVGFERFVSKTDTAWEKMMASDNQKIDNMRRLVEELILIDGSDETQLKELKTKIEDLPTIRYNRLDMKESTKIDRYDAATNEAIAQIRQAISANPNAMKYQIVNQLMAEVGLADDSVLVFRKEYDRALDSLQVFRKKNRKKLKKILPATDSLPEFPRFRLMPN